MTTNRTPESLTDLDFIDFSALLREEMNHLDGAEWQEAEDLRQECYRGRMDNSYLARIRVSAAMNARARAKADER